jgi:hypothetical protein
MFHHSTNKGLAIACLLSIFSLTFIASAHRQDAQGDSALGSLATTRSIGGRVLPRPVDPCSAVTLDRFDKIYALLKRARSEAAADVGTTLLGAPDALYNQNALDTALTFLQSTRALWISTYGGGRRVVNNAEAYAIFTSFEGVTCEGATCKAGGGAIVQGVIDEILNAQHWALTEASHSGHTPNHGRASFDFESQALVIANQLRVDAGHCYMAYYE